MSLVERRNTGESTSSQLRDYVDTIVQKLTGGEKAWSFRRRRVIASVVVLAAIAITAWISQMMHVALLRSSIMTGWTLMVCLLGLVAIGMRRRLPVLPLGSMSTWTQVHLYTGAFAVGVFLLHTSASPAVSGPTLIANGWLEGSLSLSFWLVSASGIYGIFASRRLPRRLTAVGDQPRFDQIRWHREQIALAASKEVSGLASPAATRVLGEFYDHFLSRYFQSRPSIAYLLVPQSIRRRRLLSGLNDLDRYLEAEGRQASGNLSAFVRKRDDLDYQFALQLRLRVWVMIHATLSIGLVILGIIHGILAMRFIDS